jgi:antitoxin component of RelBE/YafQ-DinJ toxin-antitoxin module
VKTSSPLSIRLDPQLQRRAAAYARKRKVGLTTALRMIISEHLDEQEVAADLDAGLRWQREQAWRSLEQWESGENAEVSFEELKAAHREALRGK